jgi:hypothetical protein
MRRSFRAAFVGLSLFIAASPAAAATIEVIKTATCGCCVKWVDHLRKAGLTVKTTNVSDVSPTARALGVPDALRSCHTARVGGYAIEGHVPAADIKRLLREKPKAAGIAVPGMPAGSPGMESATSERFATIIFDRNGKSRVYAQH